MSHLESLIVEYLDWQGYLVRRNTKVGRLKHGGWEMELDVIGYNPHTNDLVHYEPSVDAHAWETREARFQKKFDAAKKLIFIEVFSWLSSDTPLRQVAVFPSHPKGRDTIAGARLMSIDELTKEIRDTVSACGPMRSNAIPEIYPLLRTLQLSHCGYNKAI
ncbi:MAG: hypothetical protein AB1344_06005 [Pseudomonadota bacterium]